MPYSSKIARKLGVFALGYLTFGCSTLHAYGIPTGPARYAPYDGPLSIFSTGGTIPHTIEIGRVEVRGENREGAIDVMFPLFLKKVASLGGDVAVIDDVSAGFYNVTTWRNDVSPQGCVTPPGQFAMCTAQNAYPVTIEGMTIFMVGRALRNVRSSEQAP
jgi:hypothetical protein